MSAPLTTLARGLATITLLTGLALALGGAPAAHAFKIPIGPAPCGLCPILPQSPTLGPLEVETNGSAVAVQGQGFTSWGGVDLYVWQNNNPSGIAAGAFAGTVHTTAHGSALNIRLAPLVYDGPSDHKVPCLDYNTIYVVAIDDHTHLGSGVQKLVSWCSALKLPPVMTDPSLRAVLNASAGTIHLSGHNYTPHTEIAVYLLQNGAPMLIPIPTTLTARVTQFTTTLSTGHTGCSNALSWTTFALDQAANVASPLRTVQDPCSVPAPPR
jgi:hypothetical protein